MYFPLQIAAQAFVFLLAGYETTANALAFATYLLAINPKKEEAMVAEIDAFGAGLTPTYDDLQKVLLRSTLSIFGFDVSSTHFCTIAATSTSHISNYYRAVYDTDELNCRAVCVAVPVRGRSAEGSTAHDAPCWIRHHQGSSPGECT